MNKSNNTKLFINLVASLIVFVVQFFINFWLSPFIIEQLGENAYGFISLANNFTQYVTLLTIAINSMANRFISIEYNKGNSKEANGFFASVFWINVIISLLVLIISSILIINIENILNIESTLLIDVKITFALSFCNLIISFLSTCYISVTFVTNRMDLHAYTQIISNLLKVFVIVWAFIIFKPRIFFVSLGTLCATIWILVTYIFIKKKLIPKFSISIKYFNIQKIIILSKSGLWLLISNISSLLLNGMDLLIANLLISQIAMGRLSVSKQLPNAIGGVLGFLSNIFAASFTILVAQNNKKSIINEVSVTCRILGTFLTVPFSGIIVYGIDFFKLWLPQSIYTDATITQIYILMLLTLSNVIVNAYMYSIHSLFIALNKVKGYSIMILISSIISIITTIVLTYFTPLGVYAIAGTSTIVLSIVNLFFVPLYAEHIIEVPIFTFLRTIFKNYVALSIIILFFYYFKQFLLLDFWIEFTISIGIIGSIGYILSGLILWNRKEKIHIYYLIKKRLERNDYE